MATWCRAPVGGDKLGDGSHTQVLPDILLCSAACLVAGDVIVFFSRSGGRVSSHSGC